MEHLPSVRHLRHLIALADHAHFGHAAEACFVTQSTLSASIKELESLLEAPLVDRTTRHVVLTPLGIETVERARKIIGEFEELTRAVRATRKPLCGTLRMGAIPTISPYLLPRVLPDLRRAYGQLKLYLVEDQTARLVEALNDGKLDVLLLALPYDCGAVETHVLFEDPLVVGLHADHPLARSKRIAPEKLADDLLLLKDGHCLRDHALSACRIADRRNTEGFEATSLPTLVQMVDNGLGTTLLPELAVEAGVLQGTSLVTRPLQSDVSARKIGLVWRHGTGRNAEFRLLANELLKLCRPAAKP
ncbi:MAG: hydrogen peroxide-inducible genes activator [Alphaproteobacteria bacterium]|nr:hydrogen peroxide-inducible genes activator [Alphaproteobacteria bacterium]